mmetsp:Transcript_152053/g.276508  ORF Transcript_152053/g.276508 Transcript_152053/m.276508 type:complete len:231 (-) Transcript_152053:1696-2388(-)
MAMSANFDEYPSSRSEVLQMSKNMSPLFLLAAPWNSSTTPWTISAIWLTKVITLPLSTSVAVLKSRMRAQPMMHSTRVPSTMAVTIALSTPCMLCSIMFAPASPKPNARRDPILMMVFSRITVSIGSETTLLDVHMIVSLAICHLFCSCILSFCFLTSSCRNSSSDIFMAINGLSRIFSTLEIIISTGFRTSLSASFEKKSDARQRTKHTNTVMIRENLASNLVKTRLSK